MYETVPEIVASLGFPIAVACYLLYERRATTKELTHVIRNDLISSINALKIEITKLAERV